MHDLFCLKLNVPFLRKCYAISRDSKIEFQDIWFSNFRTFDNRNVIRLRYSKTENRKNTTRKRNSCEKKQLCYPKILATCRSYNIGLNIIVQNIQNIKALYEKEWESIIGNCDTLLFLGGGNEPTSLEFIVKLLGKETLATRTRGQTKGRNGSSSTNFQQTGRELMTLGEVRKLGTNQAILFIRGESPVLDEKYNIKNHPNIRLTVDGKAEPYVHKPQGAPNYALPDLPYEFKSLDDYEFINMEESEHEETKKEDNAES